MSELRIKTCVLGGVSTNCYIVYCEGGKDAVIIDPADNAAYLLNKCRELGVEPSAILLTHGHFDHILAAGDIKRAFRCQIFAGMNEDRMLQDPSLNLSGTLGTEQMGLNADQLLRDGEILHFLGIEWKVIFTPGHTSGSVCYYLEAEDVLFSGDTLFADSLGRTDLPTGSVKEIIRSISVHLFALPDDTMVYPGHGDPTTIGHEKIYNPVAAYCERRG